VRFDTELGAQQFFWGNRSLRSFLERESPEVFAASSSFFAMGAGPKHACTRQLPHIAMLELKMLMFTQPLQYSIDREMNMRRILTLGAAVLFMSALASAETYMGKLLDASCADQQKDAACSPNASTAAFAIQVSTEKTLKLDADGNKKAAQALKDNNSTPTAPRTRTPRTVQ
jgi:hypothetical protein